MKKFAILAATAALMISGAAQAATDGNLSNTSVGTLDITATIAQMVSIRGLDNVTLAMTAASFGAGGSSSAAIKDSQFCVFSNVDALGTYKITASSQVTGTSWTLNGSNSNTLPFSVLLYPNKNSSGNSNGVHPGSPSKTFTTTDGGIVARAVDPTCGGGDNASVSIRISKVAGLAAIADTYTGTLTLTVSTS